MGKDLLWRYPSTFAQALHISLDVFFDIADALEVDPADLINASVFPDRIIKSK